MKTKLAILAGLAILIRVFALNVSTHFLSDESRDLVNIHQIWVEKKLTLVGPISDDGSHVFSSLTYYMLLPFAVAYRFDPLGTVTGAAFWGIITWAVMTAVVGQTQKERLIPGAALLAVWWPLVETSRWPWNPNLVIFWLGAGIVLSNFRSLPARLASGLSLGLAIHHHWLALIPAGLLILHKRDWLMGVGTGVALAPLALFDWMHPPGIFLTRMVDYNRSQAGVPVFTLLHKVPDVFGFWGRYVFGLNPIVIPGLISIGAVAIWDIIKKTAGRIWLFMWLACLLPLTAYSLQTHYLLPALPFFVIWLFIPRQAWGITLSKAAMILIIAGSAIHLHTAFEQPDWSGNLNILRGGTKIIKTQIRSQELKNPNLAVLASPDIYTSGKKYRDLLLVSDVRLKPYEDYGASDNLFVITKSDIRTLRSDPAAEIMYFKNGPMAGEWQIPETDWRVIQLNRY